MEKKYNVDEFIDLWLSGDQELIPEIRNDIGKVYIKIQDKMNRAEAIVKSSYYNVDEAGKLVFSINSAAGYMLYCVTVVDMYSPISVDFGDAVEIFDKLNEIGIIDWVMSAVRERELKEFKMVYDMIGRDEIANHHEIHMFIERQVKTIADVLSAMGKPLAEEIKNVIDNIDPNELNRILGQLSNQ